MYIFGKRNRIVSYEIFNRNMFVEALTDKSKTADHSDEKF